MSREPLRHIRH